MTCIERLGVRKYEANRNETYGYKPDTLGKFFHAELVILLFKKVRLRVYYVQPLQTPPSK